jgi:hypothetical protein
MQAKNLRTLKLLKNVFFIVLLCASGNKIKAQNEYMEGTVTQNQPRIKLGNFTFEQSNKSYHITRTHLYDSAKFADPDNYFSMFDTMPCSLIFEHLNCIGFDHNGSNDTHVVNKTKELLAPTFHLNQYETTFSSDFEGLTQWLDTIALESMANIESYLTTGPIIGNYIWLNYSYSEYWGGAAHPNSYAAQIILNNTTGESVNYHHFFKSTSDQAMVKLLSKNFKKQYKESPWTVSENDLLTNNLTFGSNGVTFHYSPYEIGPYAMGYVEITVSYKQLLKHLNSEGLETMNAAKSIQ